MRGCQREMGGGVAGNNGGGGGESKGRGCLPTSAEKGVVVTPGQNAAVGSGGVKALVGAVAGPGHA